MIYLTYNDQPSGIYFSQVTDVCNFVNTQFKSSIRLVAFISIRGFNENKRKIKDKFPAAIVLPMFPKNKNWKLNAFTLRLLFLFIGKQNIWSRGIFATNIALNLKKQGVVKKVVFDGRGAYKAEFEEYLNKIVSIDDSIAELEKNAVFSSDFGLAVSEKLVEYWKKEYSYTAQNHVVIPCTISENSFETIPSDEQLIKTRTGLGFQQNDIVFIYSGSAADWQSVHLMDDFFLTLFAVNPNFKLIMLTNMNVKELKMYKTFSNRIVQKWVKPNEVNAFLMASDYGVLIREDAVTNQVASPTKFAEYLNAGLNVIISEKIGDFSSFVISNNCGQIIADSNKMYNFSKITQADRLKNNKLASSHFKKTNYIEQYQKIITALS